MKHVILTIVLLLASGLVIAQTKMSDQLSKTTKMNAQSKIYFAGGCFWGVEYYMKKAPGVLAVESGYIGGKVEDPSYEEVCEGNTGHVEAVRVLFDASKTDYETLTKLFFEIHDPTQQDHQGPYYGEQYRSEIFYNSPEQKAVAEKLIQELKEKGYAVVTRLAPTTTFWVAEDYHQNYYTRKGTLPYCHGYTRRF